MADRKKKEEKRKRGGSAWPRRLLLLSVLYAVGAVYYPAVVVYPLMIADFFTPWVLFESDAFRAYHSFLMARLPETDEIPLPELHAENYTHEDVLRLSHDYRAPIVIRGALKDAPAVQQWNDKNWWMEHYADEKVLCGYVDRTDKEPFCTIGQFFDAVSEGKPFYLSGGSSIFSRNPDLEAMIEGADVAAKVEPGERVATQLFMGFPTMGSDLHSAMGCNVFRQVAGQKKWWFVPTTWSAYVYGSININGFSTHTMTMIGKAGEEPSPWLNKIKRFTTTLQPGDVLINPPWMWHAIFNNGEDPNELVIGVPTRYASTECTRAAFINDPVLSLIAGYKIYKDFGSAEAFKNRKLEDEIAENRVHKDLFDEQGQEKTA